MLDFFNSHCQGLADVHPTWMPWTCLGCVSNCVSLLSTIVIQFLSLILFIFRVEILFVWTGSIMFCVSKREVFIFVLLALQYFPNVELDLLTMITWMLFPVLKRLARANWSQTLLNLKVFDRYLALGSLHSKACGEQTVVRPQLSCWYKNSSHGCFSPSFQCNVTPLYLFMNQYTFLYSSLQF